MQGEERMKAQSDKFKVTYSEDVDILMIVLSNKKIDDSYDTDSMIVQVDKEGEPVILEIFEGRKFLEDISEALPKKIKDKFWSQPAPVSIAHRIR